MFASFVGYYSTQMKKWTLESPGVGWLLHLGLFALVSATLLYSEHRAAPSVPPSTAVAVPVEGAPAPAPAPQPSSSTQHASTSLHPVPHGLPVASARRPPPPLP